MEAGYERQDSNGERHLTDEQFTDLLMGSGPASVQAHLKACAQCREEAERVSGAIGDFAEQSRLWAERRAAAGPMREVEREPALAWLLRPQAWVAGAMAIALAVGVGTTLHRNHARPVQQAIATAQGNATNTQAQAETKVQAETTKVQAEVKVTRASLKADNALLTAIDGELRAEETTPASLYGLEASSYGVSTKAAKRTSN
ncbi:MAG: hypothetical protein ACLQM6_09160 [Acidobacteriaceae bacterium]